MKFGNFMEKGRGGRYIDGVFEDIIET